MVEVRAATPGDWSLVASFFARHYRQNHPFRNKEFWTWQTESPEEAGAFIIVHEDEVVAHRAYNVGGGFVWGMMGFVDERHRRKGLLQKLYEASSERGPSASTNTNMLMMKVYRKLGWYRYADLSRLVALRPGESETTALAPTDFPRGVETPGGDRYWTQPGIRGIRLSSGTGNAQVSVGGLRLVDINNPVHVLQEAWDLGFRWVDYVTSWNDPILDRLSPESWIDDNESPIPWLLDPLVPGSKADIRVFSEKPMPPDMVIRRTYSDHGRVGSLPQTR